MRTAHSKIAQSGKVRKKCSYCGLTKNSGEFTLDNSKPDKLSPTCRDCSSKIKEEINNRVSRFCQAHGLKNTKSAFMSTLQAQRKLGWGKRRVEAAILSGDLRAVDVGTRTRSHWRIVAADVRALRNGGPPVKQPDIVKMVVEAGDDTPPTTPTGVNPLVIRAASLAGFARGLLSGDPTLEEFLHELDSLLKDMIEELT